MVDGMIPEIVKADLYEFKARLGEVVFLVSSPNLLDLSPLIVAGEE